MKVLPVSRYDQLARILGQVEDFGIWPDGLLDAYIAMISKTDGDATPLGQRPLSVLPVVHRIWSSARMVQLEGRGSVEAWHATALDIEEVLTAAADSYVHLFVADVMKSFGTVDRGILDQVLRSLGLHAWFRHAHFEYHSHVRLRFKFAVVLGEPTDGGIFQVCN